MLALLVDARLSAAELAPARPIGPPPGAGPYPAELEQKLRGALVARGADYEARTRHRLADGWPRYTNRLILEPSPYLMQHAHNPVDWYPWGDEAFERARREGKPVLLSVGYSTCHWCHVMEEESFEDLEIAEYLNRNYVAVKVDREQRPDVDGIYMAAVQWMSGGGGWPMTVWLTPNRAAFFGGTYFPPRKGARGAEAGFLEVLQVARAKYDEIPDEIAAAAAQVSGRIADAVRVVPGDELPDADVLGRAAAADARTFDAANGGFGGAPKFPRSVRLELLMRQYRRSGDAAIMAMVRSTLDAMASGGMYDQIGGGFHRYSTDATWLVPHFEKMLYDNALLAVAYLEAYQATGEPEYARVVRDVLRYVQRDMTSPRGAFYSASDADSEGKEGTFFLWTREEIQSLSPEDAALAIAYFGITDAGNFEGKNIPTARRPLAEVARRDLEPAFAAHQLERVREYLYGARKLRQAPLTDRKILPAWNGLMISAFARAAFVLADHSYAQIAEKAADFVLTQMRDGSRLRRSHFDGAAHGKGFLDDYAFMIAALLDLYSVTFDPHHLRAAIELQDVLDRHFADPSSGGYFFTPDDGEKLLAREKPFYDGAEPSGNSVALLNLLRLHELTAGDRYRVAAEALLRALAPVWKRQPESVPRLLVGVDFWLGGALEIAIVVPDTKDEAEPFLTHLRTSFGPNHVMTVFRPGQMQGRTAELIPWVADKTVRGGKPTAYVCERRVCDLPTTDPAEFAAQLDARREVRKARRGTGEAR